MSGCKPGIVPDSVTPVGFQVVSLMQEKKVAQPRLLELDLRGDRCPMPLLKAKRALNGMDSGQKLRVLATDPGTVRDFALFAEQSGNRLLRSKEQDGVYSYLLRKA